MEKERATEMEWFQYFYDNADFGPADSEVRDMLKEEFIQKTGKLLPVGYRFDSEGEEME